MKTTRALVTLAAAIAVSSVFAQNPEFVGVDAQHVYVQTGNSTATAATYNPGVTGPFAFVVTIEGTADLSGYTPTPSFTVPGGSTYAGSLLLALQAGNDWRRSNYYSSSPFAGDFPSGTYTVTGNGNTVSMNLAGNLFPIAPFVTVSGPGSLGSWVGSTLYVNPGTILTLTTNSTNLWTPDDGVGGAIGYHIGLFMKPNSDPEIEHEAFSDAAAPYFGSSTGQNNFLAISNYTFTSGSYFVEMEFNAVTDIDTSWSGVNALALYTSRTTFNIQVIPEPSTYAALFGGLALAGAAIWRRRRLA